MELIRGLYNLPAGHRGCVLTIGNFDGVHRGHQALAGRAVALGRQHGLPAAALTFEPMPREVFDPANAPPRVQTLRGKLRAMADTGLDRVVVVRFSAAFAGSSAQSFVDDLLLARLRVAAVIVGHDFHYGRCREGNVDTLRAAGARHGFGVEILDKVVADGERCSSTALRAALAEPDLSRAARLLGRPFTVLGRVRHGLKLGRTLGMPTANIEFTRPMALRQGVYAVRARVDGRLWDGVASLGVRPTLNLTRCLLETHLFGEPGDLYGRELEVEIVAWLRPELRFDSLETLSSRMQQDADDARRILSAA